MSGPVTNGRVRFECCCVLESFNGIQVLNVPVLLGCGLVKNFPSIHLRVLFKQFFVFIDTLNPSRKLDEVSSQGSVIDLVNQWL